MPHGGPVRLVDVPSAWDLLAKIYEPIDHPASIERHGYWWRGLRQHLGRHNDAHYVAVHGEPGAEDGFAYYQPLDTDAWFSGQDRTIVVHDLVTRSERAYLGLLRFLFSIDLVDRVRLGTMPVDHSLPVLLTDGRAVRTKDIRDETWLRFADVEAALAARSYAGAGSVVVDVVDELLPANTGRYRVGGGGVSRTDAPADLSLDVASLATTYLGGTAWWQLARAGRVVEHTAGALTAADALFAVQRAPFSGTMF